jgi:predicted nucleic acid-binding protein
VGRRIDTLNGNIYFDNNCFIYNVDQVAPYDALLKEIWERARQGLCGLITSELTLTEVLVKPFKAQDLLLEQGFRDLLQGSTEVTLVPITIPILEQAARIRSAISIKTPDAIHAATGLAAACAQFITNDAGFRRVAGLPVTLIGELESSAAL